MMAYIRKLREWVLGPPATVESLVRNTLFLGFMVLLLLIAGIGYRSVRSVEQLERESVTVDDIGEEHLRILLNISETAGKIIPEARQATAYETNPLMRLPSEHRLGDLKKEMDAEVSTGRGSSLADTDEWGEFEAAYREFWNAVDKPSANEWHDQRTRLLAAIKQLDQFVDQERRQSNSQAHQMSLSARRKITLATGAVLMVGVVVAALAFYEIRKGLKRLETAYSASAESRDYLQSLLDSLVSGVVVIGVDGSIQTISQSFRKLPGIGPASSRVQSFKELFRDNAALLEAISGELARQDSSSRYHGRVKLGAALFDVFASPLIVAGEQQGVILVFVDVSEMVRAQSELRRNSALAAVGQMTAQIAHEIKNPLGSIRFAAEFLKRQAAARPADAQSTIQVIERSVDHLASIVTELSEFGRPKRLNRAAVNLNDLLDDLIPMAADRLIAKQMQVKREYNRDIPVAEYDGTELRKLFLNLIINAIEASEPGSEIELRTRLERNEEVFVDIADRGSGMDGQTLSRLFEPFYTTKEKGTGLGMAIAKQIAELHGGDLIIVSRIGEGTTATVRLPITKFVEADNRINAVQRLSM
ncbi:MAG TPA: ATP-binding protein [Blastocatellia bacterium]|nr:ATP-binding protein [Blastocatellia bacterium]